MTDNMRNKILISIYKNGIFVGYIKKYRRHRNGLYRFERTKDVRDAKKYGTEQFWLADYNTSKLSASLDTYYYDDSFEFKLTTLDDREIRRAKLLILNKPRRFGLFKNKL